MRDILVEHGLEGAFIDLASDCGVLQTSDAQSLLGHVDQELDCVRNRGGWRRQINILAVSPKRPALKLTACCEAVMQAGMCDEVFGSLGSPSAGEILRRGLCCDRRRWGATGTTAPVALAKAATRLKALDLFELRQDVLQLQRNSSR